MNKSRLLKFLIGIALSSIPLLGNEADRLFYEAVRAEANGELRNAVDLYLEASTFGHSANLHGNLANLYFKLEKYGHSVLHYRKALLLRPDDREFATNLSFTQEIAGIQNLGESLTDPAFSASNTWAWVLVLSIIFWGGLTLFAILLPHRLSKTSAWAFLTLWIGLLSFLSWATHQSSEQSYLLNREVIVIQPETARPNIDAQVPLRRFAGVGSSANTKVKPGESLFLDLDDQGAPKSHPNTEGMVWYLLRSLDGKKKGWLKADEFSPILGQLD